MKKRAFFLLTIAAAFILCGCSDNEENKGTAKPKMEWAANPDFGVMNIAEQMDIDIRITAEAGIRDFVVTVNSETLAPLIAYMTTDGSANMDLINDTKLIAAFTELGLTGLPMGDNLKNKSDVAFSLSELVPMIAALSPTDGSKHIFTLKLTDNENRTLTRELTFRYAAPQE